MLSLLNLCRALASSPAVGRSQSGTAGHGAPVCSEGVFLQQSASSVVTMAEHHSLLKGQLL